SCCSSAKSSGGLGFKRGMGGSKGSPGRSIASMTDAARVPAFSRRRALLAGAALGWAGASGSAPSAPALTVRGSHVVADDTPKGLAAQRFRALVQDRSGGRIAVAVYP